MQSNLHARGAKYLAMKTIGQQVADFMEWRGWKARQMAEHIQKYPGGEAVKRQHIESLMQDGVGLPRYLGVLALSMEASADDLINGRYVPPDAQSLEKDGATEASKDPGPMESSTHDAIKVQLLANSGSMGTGSDTLPDDVLVGQISLSPEWVRGRIRPSSVDALRFIHAYGDSMCPTFADGDVLLVDTGAKDPSRADGVYVLSTAVRVFIKRVTSRFDGGFDVSSDNPAVKVISSLNGEHDVNVLGRVVWVWNGKRL